MRLKIGMLYVLLALALAVTNMTASGHASSHYTNSSELCMLCVHAAGTDGVIASESAVPQFIPCRDCPDLDYTSPYLKPVTLRVHPSRAPPHVI